MICCNRCQIRMADDEQEIEVVIHSAETLCGKITAAHGHLCDKCYSEVNEAIAALFEPVDPKPEAE
jgi:hypothetical protein